MAVLKVKRALKEYSPADNANVLRIEYVIEDESGAKEYNQAFPLGTSKEQMKEELKKALDTHVLEKKQAEENAKLAEAEAQTDEAIKELEGFSVDETNQEEKKVEEVAVEPQADAQAVEPVEEQTQ